MFVKKVICPKIFSNACFSSLFKNIMSRKIPIWQKRLNEIKSQYGNQELTKIKVSQVFKGMEGLPIMLYSASVLNPKLGVVFRGYSIDEISEYLPKAKDGPLHEGDEPLSEALLWLLITGDLPTPHEYEEITIELQKRSEISEDIKNYIKKFPKEMPSMTQLSSVLLYLQPNSLFFKAVNNGVNQSYLWEYMFEDALNLLAKLPQIVSCIYAIKYNNSGFLENKKNLDWAANFAHLLGFDSYETRELFRALMTVYADQDGGDVGSHASHLLGTAEVDPYLAFSAAINGMAGPLHGFESKEALNWLIQMKISLGDYPSEEHITQYIVNYLKEKNEIPGYGHHTLTHLDSRFLHLKSFIEKHIKQDPLVSLAQKCYKIVPGIFKTMKNVQNPYPTVDALSGVLLNYYGFKEVEFYLLLNTVARSMGCMSNIIITKALNVGTERLISLDLNWLNDKFEKKEKDPQIKTNLK